MRHMGVAVVCIAIPIAMFASEKDSGFKGVCHTWAIAKEGPVLRWNCTHCCERNCARLGMYLSRNPVLYGTL